MNLKRILALFLAIVMVLSTMNFTVFAAEGTVYEIATFEVSNKADLDAALAVAEPGDVIKMTADITSDAVLLIEKAITLDLGGYKLTTTNGWGGLQLKNGCSVKNGTLLHTGRVNAIKVWDVISLEDLVIEVTDTTENKTVGGIAIQENAAGVDLIKNVTLRGEGLDYGIETYNCGNATSPVIGSMENVTIDAVGTGMLISAPCGMATGCTFKGGVNGIEIWIKGTYSATLELVDCDVVGGVFAHDESSSTPGIVNNGTLSLTADAATTGVSAEDITLTIARAENVEGTLAEIENNAVAKVNNTYYATFAEAIAAIGSSEVVIDLLKDVTLDYGAREAYGTTETTSVTINGNNKTLTLNQTNSDWSSFGLANADAKLVLNDLTIEKTGYGDTSGAWNTHTINLTCNVEMNDVIVNNSVSVQNGATLNNVTINEVNGFYGLWIKGNGQTVTVNGGAINATNGGRGIKIADQYIDAPVLVTLNVNDTKFNTAKKAAVLVSSKAGAAITASGYDITNVAEDSANLVWVDEDWKEYSDKVTVTGGSKYQEGTVYVAQIEGGASFATLDEAVKEAETGATITILKNGEYDLPAFSGKELTFKGESKDGVIINDAPDARSQNWVGSTIYFENLTAKGATQNYMGLANGVVAVKYNNCNINNMRFLYAETVSFENCEFNSGSQEHSFWTYGAKNITVTNCTFSYADRAVNCYSESGADHETDITFTGCTFAYAGTATAPEGAVEINSGSSKSIDLTMTNCTAPEKGAMWFNSRWDSKNGANTTVTVDGSQVWPVIEPEITRFYLQRYENGTAAIYVDLANVDPSDGIKAEVYSDISKSDKFSEVKDYADDFGITVNQRICTTEFNQEKRNDLQAGALDTLSVYIPIGSTDSYWNTVWEDNGKYLTEAYMPTNVVVTIGEKQYELDKFTVLDIPYYSEYGPVTHRHWDAVAGVEDVALPTATVTQLENEDLTFALSFTADPVSSSDQLRKYWDWYADFELVVSDDVTFNANGNADGYLSGQYDAHADSWLNVPFDNVEITSDNPFRVMDYADEIFPNNGLKFRYFQIYGFVQTFNCGVFLEEEFKAANPDFEVKLALKMYDNGDKDGDVAGYAIGPVHEFSVAKPVAKIGDDTFGTLAKAIAAAQPNDTITLLADVTEDVTINKSITLDGGNFKYTGNISVSGTTSEVTVKNVSFENGTGYAITTNRIKSITVEDCTVTNYGYGFLYANKSTPTVVVKNVTVDGGNYGFHWVYGTSATLENVTMTNVTNGLLIQNYAGKTVTLKNCNLPNINIWERDGSSGVQTFKFEGSNTVSTLSTSQYAKYVLAAVDATLTAPEGFDVTTDLEGYFVKYVDGTYESVKPVAKIGDVEYTSLADAVAAANNETVLLIDDIELDESITIAKDKTVTLDLNGKTITATDNATNSNFNLFVNKGNLTVCDNAGEGKITLTAKNNRGWSNSSTIISNEAGVLNVNGGILEHLGGSDMAYVIDNNSTLGKTETTVSGGTLKSPYRAIRLFQNHKTEDNIVNVTGGTISARAGVWLQQPSTNANVQKGTLNVTGGNFDCVANAVVIDIQGAASSTVNISDGEFSNTSETANLLLIWPMSDMNAVHGAVANMNITGGTFNCAGEGNLVGILNGADTNGNVTISGGIYSEDVSDYCAEGFTCEANEDGTYGVIEKTPVTEVALNSGATSFQDYPALVSYPTKEKHYMLTLYSAADSNDYESYGFEIAVEGQDPVMIEAERYGDSVVVYLVDEVTREVVKKTYTASMFDNPKYETKNNCIFGQSFTFDSSALGADKVKYRPYVVKDGVTMWGAQRTVKNLTE